MRLKFSAIWVLAVLLIGVLILFNRLGVQDLQQVDIQSVRDRAQIHAELDSLEARIGRLESERGWSR